VHWRVAGSDGHPVEGTYAFTVQSAFPAELVEQTGPPPLADMEEEEAGITVESPAYVAARWLTFAAMLSTIGAVAFHFLVLLPARAREPVLSGVLDTADRWGAGLGRGAALFLALAAGVRLLLQLEALGGGDAALLRDLLLGTSWGFAWFVHVAGALMAALCFHRVRGGGSGWGLAAAATVMIAFGISWSSHAAASDLATIAVPADMIHVLAVSGWLGTLLVLVGVGIPAVMQDDPRTGRFSSVGAMLAAFSPRALIMAAVGAGTGVLSALLHLPALPALWQTGYGRMLLAKVALVGVAAAFGVWNWRRMKPRLEAGDPPIRIQRTATGELLVGALVLLATAVLVALPTP
jgi:copper transport protein